MFKMVVRWVVSEGAISFVVLNAILYVYLILRWKRMLLYVTEHVTKPSIF